MTIDQTDSDVIKEIELPEDIKDKAHPWRVCPIGKHYVRTHVLHIPPSKKHPEGQVVTRHAHCADNPSHKDVLSYDELQIIAKTHFLGLVGAPKAGVLTKFPRADEFDLHIRGWVHYWNDIFHPQEPLDPNLVKALIASESSFRPEQDTPQSTTEKNKKIGHACGLMQITESTLKIIGAHKGEIKDHLIHITHKEIMDPSANICVGIRWLFTKKTTARERLHHTATWDDAVAEYKGILKAIVENKDPHHNPDPYNEMPKFRSFYKKLQES
ncbi:MAG: transglycosylase SLT domain-containing protein [Gammaproteobacteria bacterium]|nr:transglycosylase SLT domain-containing protein [Gammaproteobacteria bacterium]